MGCSLYEADPVVQRVVDGRTGDAAKVSEALITTSWRLISWKVDGSVRSITTSWTGRSLRLDVGPAREPADTATTGDPGQGFDRSRPQVSPSPHDEHAHAQERGHPGRLRQPSLPLDRPQTMSGSNPSNQ